MEFHRNIEKKLKEWSQSPFRKPLVLRGARQVGKTTAVKQFASGYEQFIYLNLETNDAESFEGERDRRWYLTGARRRGWKQEQP